MHIGVIGAGRLGATLAEWCVESGHDVAVTSRHPERLTPLVERLGGDHVTAMPVADAAAYADAVLFAPAWSSAREAVDLAAGGLDGKVVIDATNPPEAVPHGLSGLETLMGWAPEAQWVKAFNTLPATVLSRRRGHDPLLAEFVCTDLTDARRTASRLIADLGFAPFYAGGAETARLTETGGPLQMTEVSVQDATQMLAYALAER
ncbi:NADPH-dependent F420 reductase [Paractinoplanes rishiriensis]|uniref:NADPH-dependent F420 reductase n=1 Tax=Paractinoplanes rishiriensis TaxID=1050105 RepID=A0A919MY15_9ACTN|nr:NAD(P)-binding domain-containing protein [Actinoplanes rishiriensis]GIE99309.1 NADPH-dependent F420 reductase [Actinoplanes rishiriensis]